jgi:hypothetical protein
MPLDAEPMLCFEQTEKVYANARLAGYRARCLVPHHEYRDYHHAVSSMTFQLNGFDITLTPSDPKLLADPEVMAWLAKVEETLIRHMGPAAYLDQFARQASRDGLSQSSHCGNAHG